MLFLLLPVKFYLYILIFILGSVKDLFVLKITGKI